MQGAAELKQPSLPCLDNSEGCALILVNLTELLMATVREKS